MRLASTRYNQPPASANRSLNTSRNALVGTGGKNTIAKLANIAKPSSMRAEATLDVYLIRHADAQSTSAAGCASDADRPLSDRGREECRQLSMTLQRHGITFDAIASSPLLRAKQTTEELLRHWSKDRPESLEWPELSPGARPKKLAQALCELQRSSVALVGHQPDLGAWAAWVIGSKRAHIDFEKAGAALIACSDEPRKGGGILVWLTTPLWYDSPTAK